MVDNTDFINDERKKLQDLQREFTPEQEREYSEEVEYINSLLTALGKSKSNKDEKKIKKKIQGGITKLVNNFSFKKMSDVTIEKLPDSAIEDAKLIEIGTKYYKMNGIDSDNYVAQSEGLDKNWKIDEELSDSRGIVLNNEKTGKTKIAFRGTDAKGMNLDDIQTDAQIYAGTEGNSTHFKTAQQQAQDVITKYGKENVSVTGYSLGGNKSLAIGQAYDIPSTGFNSFIGKNLVKRPDTFTGVRHKLYRTREDLPSIQSAYLQGKSNIDVDVVSTRGSLGRSLNPYAAHALNNFTSNVDRQGNESSLFVEKTKNLVDHAHKHGELRLFNDMIEYQKGKPKPRTIETPYQQQLDIRVQNLPKPHPPRSVVDDAFEQLKAQERVKTNVNPLFETPQTTREVNPLFENTQTVPDNVQRLDYQPRQIGRNKFVEPLTTDLAANTGNAELDDLLRFTQDQLTKKPLRFKRNIDVKTRGKLTGLRNKTKADFTRTSNQLENQADRLENRLTEPIPTAEVVGNYNLGIDRAGLKPAARYNPGTVVRGVPSQLKLKEKPSFTDFANENGLDVTNDHHKVLWKKSGGTLTESEKIDFDPDTATGNSDAYLDEFASKDLVNRNADLVEHSFAQQSMENEINNFDNSGIRSSSTGASYAGEIVRGLHPSNLIVGLGASKVSEQIMKKYVDPTQGLSKDSDLRTAEEGALTGAVTSTILGTALLPETVAGASGYVVGKEATGGIYSGLQKAGASQDVSASLADIGGGAAGGAAAGFAGTVAASALAGTTLGPEGTVIGAGVGALMGGAAYGLGKLGIGGNEYTDFVSPDQNTGITTVDFSKNN